MTSEKAKETPSAHDRIDVDNDHEIDYWTTTLDVSEQSLRDAVARVGSAISDVRRALDK